MASVPTELPPLNLSDPSRQKKVEALLSPLILDRRTEDRIRATFLEEMDLGLAENPSRESSLLMANTFVSQLTNGTEEGTYLALDIGGTNFRVILVTFEKGKLVHEDVEYYKIPKPLFHAEGVHLFDFMAESIEDFLTKRSLIGKRFEVGFTFSFPMIQTEIDCAILTSWTKSYKCPGVEGHDAVAILRESIKKRKNLDVHVTAILNDTTGTLVKGSYDDKRCAIGMILGTGNNACYLEKTSRIKKWVGKHEEQEEVVDIEWGAFGDNGVLDFLKTKWDALVDAKSLIPKSFTFEKYVGGKYLGDVTREVLVTLATEGLFCNGSSEVLETHGSLTTSSLSKIEEEAFAGGSSYARTVLESLGLSGITEDDCKILQYTCGVVAYRATHLVCLLCSILMNIMDRPHCTIAVDGSLFEHHPRFRPLKEHLLRSFCPDKKFSLLLTKDGSGIGAGLVAAVVNRIKCHH